jgi:hypothetical protein
MPLERLASRKLESRSAHARRSRFAGASRPGLGGTAEGSSFVVRTVRSSRGAASSSPHHCAAGRRGEHRMMKVRRLALPYPRSPRLDAACSGSAVAVRLAWRRVPRSRPWATVLLAMSSSPPPQVPPPNPSVNRTSTSGLRPLAAAGYLER